MLRNPQPLFHSPSTLVSHTSSYLLFHNSFQSLPFITFRMVSKCLRTAKVCSKSLLYTFAVLCLSPLHFLSQINKCLVVKLHNSTWNTPHSFIKYLDILNTKLLSGRLLQMPLRLVTVGVQYSSVFRCISQYISSVHSAVRAVDRGLHENDTILLYLHSLGSELTNDSSISIRWNRCLGMKGEWTGFCSLWGQSCAESRHWSQ